MNRKKTQRLYREEDLSVRKRRGRKKATGMRAPPLTVALPNARWSVDFVHDQFAQGRRFRIFNVIDDVTKDCLAAVVNTSISGRRVARELTVLFTRRGKPGLIVSELPLERHWSERQWRRHRIHLECDACLVRGDRRALALYRARKANARHGICETFNSKMRDELLHETLFFGLDHARSVVAEWMDDYNTNRPHSAFGYQTPSTQCVDPLPPNSPQWAVGSTKWKRSADRPLLPLR